MPPGPESNAGSKVISYQDAPHALAQDLEKHDYAAAKEVLDQFNGFIKTNVAKAAVNEVSTDRKKNPNLPVVEFHTGTDKNGEYLSDITVQTGNGKTEFAYKDTATHIPPEAPKPAKPPESNALQDWINKHNPLKRELDKAAKQGDK